MEKILLPKPHFSWSQLNLWETRPREYIKKYIHGEDMFVTKEMRFGKRLADALDGEDVGDPVLDTVATLLRRYPVMEKKILIGLPSEAGVIPLLGFLDSYDPDTHAIREYKTGKTKWTKARVAKHGQLHFYALLVYLKYKKMPAAIDLDWIQTENDDNGGIACTGDIHSFSAECSVGNVMEIANRIKAAAGQISDVYRREMSGTL